MIPVQPQSEPPDFNQKVRIPGQSWLRNKGIAPGAPPLKAGTLPAYWSKSQKNLWDAYHGVCSYLSMYFYWETGASFTDHFVPKSKNAWKAYEWDNYRLSALGPNRRKGIKTNILDPFALQPGTFTINFVSGTVSIAQQVSVSIRTLAQDTIDELGLNEPETCRTRTECFDGFLSHNLSSDYLSRKFPFVHAELVRQGYVS